MSLNRLSSGEIDLNQIWEQVSTLTAYQHNRSCQYNSLDLKFLKSMAAELGIAIQQLELNQDGTKRRSPQIDHLKNSAAVLKSDLNPTKTNFHHHDQIAPPQSVSVGELKAFDQLQTPIWIYDIRNSRMWWVNQAALHIWNVQSREELLNRNFSDMSESTHIRLQGYLNQFEEGKIIAENWTFYPEGEPVSVSCLCSGIQIEAGRMAMLVEGRTQATDYIDQEILRAIETLRHTTLIISLYTSDGVPLMQNPAALHCYGDTLHPNSAADNAFLRHFVDPEVGQQAMTAIDLDEVVSLETQVFTTQGIRWHEMDIRCNCDPITGNRIILVNEKDITKQQAALAERQLAEKALRESEKRYRSVINTMAEGIVLQQADGSITACNQSVERILGLTSDQMIGRTSIDQRWRAIHEDDSPFPGETHPAIVTLRTGKPQFNVVMGVQKPDGNLTWISINSQPLFCKDAVKPYAVVSSFTDITERKQAQQALQKQAQRERMLYAIAQHIRQSLNLDEILHTTVADVRHFLQTDRVIVYRFNPDWSGVVVKESVAEDWNSILNMAITDSYFMEKSKQSYQQGVIRVTPDIYTAGFSPCHVELLTRLQVRAKLVVPIVNCHGLQENEGDRLWGLLIVHHCQAPRQWQVWESELLQQLATQVAIAIQQSELYYQLQLANQQLQHLALLDPLTQIANRRCFDIKLNDVWQNFIREEGTVSLLLCDIDYFKYYNDTYGHAAGDNCLRLVAQALQKTVKRCTDLAARYGGEEFAVILPNTDLNGATQVAEEIHQAIHQLNIPHHTSAVKPYLTLSIGIATVTLMNDLVPLDLIEAADQALYQAKAQGRDCFFVSMLSLPIKN